jgi:hypothetical protein
VCLVINNVRKRLGRKPHRRYYPVVRLMELASSQPQLRYHGMELYTSQYRVRPVNGELTWRLFIRRDLMRFVRRAEKSAIN